MSEKILKSRYYKYPSTQERKQLTHKIPKYERFDFKPIKVFSSALNKTLPFEEINRLDNLYYWNLCLSNKFGNLRETHLFILTHFERGFNENHLSCNQRELVDRILFDNFVEIFYYHFFSTTDNFAQILNLYFNLKIGERQLHFNNVLFEKIKNSAVRVQLELFNNSLKKAREIRNSFTHRFPINQKDFRTTITKENNSVTLSGGSGKMTSTEKIIANINDITNSLKVLTQRLKLEMITN